jgi:hypothetical protein
MVQGAREHGKEIEVTVGVYCQVQHGWGAWGTRLFVSCQIANLTTEGDDD